MLARASFGSSGHRPAAALNALRSYQHGLEELILDVRTAARAFTGARKNRATKLARLLKPDG